MVAGGTSPARRCLLASKIAAIVIIPEAITAEDAYRFIF
jgi:hypothetical protein